MKVRIYTETTYLDIIIKEIYTEEMIMSGLEEGNTICLTKEDGNAFILNTINCVAIEILNTPPHERKGVINNKPRMNP